jgi:alkanesulfonate monooxygenase SsuD/methylene tetrahydromethanopterin reductase-like flavin-dependent oxidoreductase (luciferase family)
VSIAQAYRQNETFRSAGRGAAAIVAAVRYGVALGAAAEERDPRALAALAALAEASGWDGIFLEDYLVYQGHSGMPTYDPWVVLAAMAMPTTRIRLGTTVAPLPRRELAAAGATRWSDWMPPGDLETTRPTVGAGPLRG